MSAEGATYLDSSALVKFVVREPETPALLAHVRDRNRMVSSALASVEVVRAVRQLAPAEVGSARQMLQGLNVVPLNEALLKAAADLEDPAVRALDAIHVAAAASLASELREVVTYDRRMADAAAALGLAVAQPA
ncbi:MAG: type II toxin-antitoxin system VapC family toxin [Actinomycetota bacterium]|nr:type II toxin-antitoxin system VapC family toxin [Actinomycetota bacterium]